MPSARAAPLGAAVGPRSSRLRDRGAHVDVPCGQASEAVSSLPGHGPSVFYGCMERVFQTAWGPVCMLAAKLGTQRFPKGVLTLTGPL